MAKVSSLLSSSLLLCLLLIMTPSSYGQSDVKLPNVSGQFYDADPQKLSSQVDRFVTEALVKPVEQPVEVIIAPHAGYFYSGAVAGYSFKAVSQKKYKTIIIIAPSHYYGFDGMSVWAKGGFKTPLGVVEVDESFSQELIAQDGHITFDRQAFEQEHSLEVEIPFIQRTFKDYKIVPVIIGQPSLQTLDIFARSLVKLIGDRKDVLIVVSTDLSHYHDDATARKMDELTIDAVKALNLEKLWRGHQDKTMEMCGFMPVSAAILYARHKGLTNVDVLHYANSGDVSNDRERVVGYSSMIIYNNTADTVLPLTLDQKRHLITIAKDTLDQYIKTGKLTTVSNQDPRLNVPEGAFVSLYKAGNLRGCIGQIIGQQPICLTVRDMTVAAAVDDPRFRPVVKDELKDIKIEISVLSRPWVISSVDEIELGKHGVIVSRGNNHGVFLPQVADKTHWTKEEFLSELCSQKAGLPSDCWKDPSTTIEIYTADVFAEDDVQ